MRDATNAGESATKQEYVDFLNQAMAFPAGNVGMATAFFALRRCAF